MTQTSGPVSIGHDDQAATAVAAAPPRPMGSGHTTLATAVHTEQTGNMWAESGWAWQATKPTAPGTQPGPPVRWFECARE